MRENCKGDWVKGGRQKQCQNVSWMEKEEEQREKNWLSRYLELLLKIC